MSGSRGFWPFIYKGTGVHFADFISFFLNILWKWNNLVSLRPNHFISIWYLKTVAGRWFARTPWTHSRSATGLKDLAHFNLIHCYTPSKRQRPILVDLIMSFPDSLSEVIKLVCKCLIFQPFLAFRATNASSPLKASSPLFLESQTWTA